MEFLLLLTGNACICNFHHDNSYCLKIFYIHCNLFPSLDQDCIHRKNCPFVRFYIAFSHHRKIQSTLLWFRKESLTRNFYVTGKSEARFCNINNRRKDVSSSPAVLSLLLTQITVTFYSNGTLLPVQLRLHIPDFSVLQ